MVVARTQSVSVRSTFDFRNSIRLFSLERLDHLVKKFQHKCEIHEEWSEGKIDLLKSNNFEKCSLNDLRALSRKHLAFESDLAAHQDRVEQIAAIAQELNALRYEKISSINERCQKICNEWDTLGELTQKRRRLLTEAERTAERIDSLFLDYAKKAAPYLNWLDGAREDLVDMFYIHTLDEICGKTIQWSMHHRLVFSLSLRIDGSTSTIQSDLARCQCRIREYHQISR